MTLSRFKPWAQRGLAPFVGVASRLGLSPNQVSALSFMVAITAAAVYTTGSSLGYFAGSLLVVVSGLLDVLDGEIAREHESQSIRGDYLDHVLDRFSDVVVLLGVVVAVEMWFLGVFALIGVLLTSYMGTQAQAVGAGREYGGLVGRSDRLALIALGGVLASIPIDLPVLGAFGWVLAVLAVLGNFTALQRFYVTWRELS